MHFTVCVCSAVLFFFPKLRRDSKLAKLTECLFSIGWSLVIWLKQASNQLQLEEYTAFENCHIPKTLLSLHDWCASLFLSKPTSG